MRQSHSGRAAVDSYRRTRVIATRGRDGWRYRLGRPSRLAASYSATLRQWLATSQPGDQAVWFDEYLAVTGWGIGASGLRLTREERIVAEQLDARRN